MAERPVLMFDSGIGGLTVLREARVLMPGRCFVYVADDAAFPYGAWEEPALSAHLVDVFAGLLDRFRPEISVIACNTASAVALYMLEEALRPTPVIGVIEPGARAGVAATRNRRIAVIATEGTVKGGAYARAIRKLMSDADIMQQPCQVFVALAEEGWTNAPATVAAIEHYLGTLFRNPSSPDTLVLGCTHFPVLAGAIRQVVGNNVTLVDSAETTASAVAEALDRAGLKGNAGEGGRGTSRFLATDSPERFARVGAIFLGRPIDPASVELVDLRAL